MPRSPVDPEPCGTFSQPTSKSPFSPFLPGKVSPTSQATWQKRSTLKLHSLNFCHSQVVPKKLRMAAFKPGPTWPGFKSQCQSSSASPFPTPPTFNYTCQHSLFFQLYWTAVVSLGRCGPVVGSQSSPSSHAGSVTRGSCLPVASWVEVTPIPSPPRPPKAWPQLFNISMKPDKGYRYAKCPF